MSDGGCVYSWIIQELSSVGKALSLPESERHLFDKEKKFLLIFTIEAIKRLLRKI